MNTISFDLGIKEYQIGAFTAHFNPTDMNFIERVFDAFEKLDNLQVKYSTELTENKDKMQGNELFDLTKRMNIDMRTVLDNLFGEGFSMDVFNTLHVYAMADGLPAWSNLMLAIVDELDESFVSEKKKTNPRIQQYISKYTKK
ncbi:MAG: hypothetical protein KBS60_05810 [Phascolarctobacterium sp.]|nr:hypothetical protein [Candidatus Phascolarctobacterium caballi]